MTTYSPQGSRPGAAEALLEQLELGFDFRRPARAVSESLLEAERKAAFVGQEGLAAVLDFYRTGDLEGVVYRQYGLQPGKKGRNRKYDLAARLVMAFRDCWEGLPYDAECPGPLEWGR